MYELKKSAPDGADFHKGIISPLFVELSVRLFTQDVPL